MHLLLEVKSCIRNVILVLVWEIMATLKLEKWIFLSSFDRFAPKV